ASPRCRQPLRERLSSLLLAGSLHYRLETRALPSPCYGRNSSRAEGSRLAHGETARTVRGRSASVVRHTLQAGGCDRYSDSRSSHRMVGRIDWAWWRGNGGKTTGVHSTGAAWTSPASS